MSPLKIVTKVIIISGILMGLPACGPQYRKRPLIPLSKRTADYEEVKHDVVVRARKLDREEANYIFDNRGARLLKGSNPIYPIQLSVINYSKNVYVLEQSGIGLPLTALNNVGAILSSSTFGEIVRLTGLGILGGIAVGVPVAVLTGSSYAANIAAQSIYASGVITGICSGVQSSQANNALVQDILEKALAYPVILYPSEHRDVIIFVDKKSYQQQFKVTLYNHDIEQDKLVFTVHMRQLYVPTHIYDY